MQTIYTADPAPLVYNGRVYLYTGHDEDGSTYFTMKEWRVWSSADMVNWTDHGSPMSLATFSWADADAWAGQAVDRNGKFYWYVPVTNRSTGADGHRGRRLRQPDRPVPRRARPPAGRERRDRPDRLHRRRRPGVPVLGQPQPVVREAERRHDLVLRQPDPDPAHHRRDSAPAPADANRPTLYEEGPWVYKRNGLYYNVFAAKCCSEFIAYSTAPGPTGPWTYRGTIMPTQGSSFTNHAGVIDFKGGSYFFYHNGALPGGGGYTRSVAVEKFSYNADGTIPTINMTTTGRTAGRARSTRTSGRRPRPSPGAAASRPSRPAKAA